MYVINVEGSGDETCSCGSWKAHWENFTGKAFPTTCPTVGCDEAAEDGAHVVKATLNDQKIYIVPLCKRCNQRDEMFEVDLGDDEFAPAEVCKNT